MENAKLPLVGGIIFPLHNDDGGLTVIGGPVDKDLPRQGEQAYYEVHLWLVPSAIQGTTTWKLYSVYDGDIASLRLVSRGVVPIGNTYPRKILDGYPMRGGTTLSMEIVLGDTADDQYPVGAQVYGYAYRVGQGSVVEQERRFIGAESPNGIALGVPLDLPAATKVQVHKFSKDRIDEIALAFVPTAADARMKLYFEDVNDNPIITGHYAEFKVPVETEQNSVRDPQSAYTIKGATFCNNIYQNLDHISLESDVVAGVHGYFTRR